VICTKSHIFHLSVDSSIVPRWFLFRLWEQAAIRHTIKWKDLDISGTKGLTSVCGRKEWVYFLYHIQLYIIKTISDIAAIWSQFLLSHVALYRENNKIQHFMLDLEGCLFLCCSTLSGRLNSETLGTEPLKQTFCTSVRNFLQLFFSFFSYEQVQTIPSSPRILWASLESYRVMKNNTCLIFLWT
jgi:hypothetical protein